MSTQQSSQSRESVDLHCCAHSEKLIDASERCHGFLDVPVPSDNELGRIEYARVYSTTFFRAHFDRTLDAIARTASRVGSAAETVRRPKLDAEVLPAFRRPRGQHFGRLRSERRKDARTFKKRLISRGRDCNKVNAVSLFDARLL